jgi:phytoene dehydrogenase-like protein
MRYDVVVVGAGVNGLTLATRLASADLRVAVFERAPVPGGQCRSDASLAPGFSHEPHATFLNYAALAPPSLARWWSDTRTVVPEVQHAIVFPDGTPGIALHRQGREDATHASIARHSTVDARTFAWLLSIARKLRPDYARVMYTPPTKDSLARYLDVVTGALPGAFVGQSAAELIDLLFVSSAVRTLLLRLTGELGPDLEAPGGGVSFLGTVMALVGTRAVPLGGMADLAATMARSATHAGVQLHLQSEVRQIVVNHGRATGVVLDNGVVVDARLAVVSSASLRHTFSVLLGEAEIGERDRGRWRRLVDSPGTLASQPFCLCEPPRYRSASGEPDVNRSAQVFLGLDSPEAVISELREVRAGGLPRPGGAIAHHSLVDRRRAPAGKSALSVTSLFPPAASLTADMQRKMLDAYPAALLKRWREYAPNITPENVLAMRANPLDDGDRAVALVGGEAEYATTVSGCYVCGAASYPGGGVHGACGWNAAEVILRRLHANSGPLADN